MNQPEIKAKILRLKSEREKSNDWCLRYRILKSITILELQLIGLYQKGRSIK